MQTKITRRSILKTIGYGVAAAPASQLGVCGNGEGPAKSALSNGAAGGAWATGGTAAMKTTYADPFATGAAAQAACKLTCSATVGPCYAQTKVRKDISEGHVGLPVRLALLVLDESCHPLPNVELDLWHAAPEGEYSGNDANGMCTGNDPKALAARWFRGKQTTDAKGRVDFDTCFPGWYRGRSIHIHFTARVNGTEHVTSQLFFDDALVDGIVATQVNYKERGPRDTTNKNDGVMNASKIGDYILQTERQPDGALLAWKALSVRSAN
jgi:protocatechuate 3,4-dioxygenase beta subunit